MQVTTYEIHCRDFGLDCNAVMKGKTREAAAEAATKHGVSMHHQDAAELKKPEKFAEIMSKAREVKTEVRE